MDKHASSWKNFSTHGTCIMGSNASEEPLPGVTGPRRRNNLAYFVI